MPVFTGQEDSLCKVYFSFSNFNSKEDVSKQIQASITYQNTNISALPVQYTDGIAIFDIQEDLENQQYYIVIDPKSFSSSFTFDYDVYYKVQLRFIEAGVAELPGENPAPTADWLYNNQNFFSEWSTVTLIKQIHQPSFSLVGFEDQAEDVVIHFGLSELIGTLNTESQTEYLSVFQVEISKENGQVVLDSGRLSIDNYNLNQFRYVLPIVLNDGEHYSLKIYYETNGGYGETYNYSFSIIEDYNNNNNITISYNVIPAVSSSVMFHNDNFTYEEKENPAETGRIKLTLNFEQTNNFISSNYTIRRAKENENGEFILWEDVYNGYQAKAGVVEWYDNTIESNVKYKYVVQLRGYDGRRGNVMGLGNNPVSVAFDDIFLVRGNKQLKIKYNPQISSFKETVIESKTETIGSKYPFIKRNGRVKYKTFPISGLITHFCDEDQLFIAEDKVFSNDEYYYERRFRERVYDFLYDNTAKLFKSKTEGNILIKLMDISFTPNQQLGRLIYSFSATAVEIEEASVDNLHSFGIQDFGELKDEPIVLTVNNAIGQIYYPVFLEGQINVNNLITDKIKNQDFGKIRTLKQLTSLKITFESDPYWIDVQNGYSLINGGSPKPTDFYGYLIKVNGSNILIPANKQYDELYEKIPVASNNETEMLSDAQPPIYSYEDYWSGQYSLSNVEITNLIIYGNINTKVIIDYVYSYTSEEDQSNIIMNTMVKNGAGQVVGVYQPKESIFKIISNKYWLLWDNEKFLQQLNAVLKMDIETIPGTKVMVKTLQDADYQEHKVGVTGILSFDYSPKGDEEAVNILDIYLDGIDLRPAPNGNREPREFEYITNNEVYQSINNIDTPLYNNVYNFADGSSMIYFNSSWYPVNYLEDQNIVHVEAPIPAMINYIFQLLTQEKGGSKL